MSPLGRGYLRTVSILGALVVAESLFRLLGSHLQPQWFLLALLTLISGSASSNFLGHQVQLSIPPKYFFTAVPPLRPGGRYAHSCFGLSRNLILDRKTTSSRCCATAVFNTAAPALSLWCSAHLFFYTAQIKPLVEQPASLIHLHRSAPYFRPWSFLRSLILASTAGLSRSLSRSKNARIPCAFGAPASYGCP